MDLKSTSSTLENQSKGFFLEPLFPRWEASITKEYIKLIVFTFVIPDLIHPSFISWKTLVALKPEWGIWFVDTMRKMVVHLENEHGAFNIMGS
jgi:hypothetical protein